ncbi:hypothetical protein Goshw_014557 [Gossypium schwendimanii]|uniref:Uncharacterized protein n=1 Tax=Gossypium schwendimanii TaxID=34291 RepID=A0A7J9MNA4_GOSSC|nr:hypothetical protein [Gossypium schwendimanii]
MALVVGKNMLTRSFARIFADIDLDDEIFVNEQIKFVGEQLSKIANALEQFIEDKTPHLYGEVILTEVEIFDDDFLCSAFDFLVGCKFEAKAFLAKNMKHRKIWPKKFSQG